MARSLRIQYPEAYYHVTCRGNERKEIFADDYDRKIFMEMLGASLEVYNVNLLAFSWESSIDVFPMKKPDKFNGVLLCLYSKSVIANSDTKVGLVSLAFPCIFQISQRSCCFNRLYKLQELCLDLCVIRAQWDTDSHRLTRIFA